MNRFLQNIFLAGFTMLMGSVVYAQSCNPDYGLPVKKIKVGSIELSYTEYGQGKPVILLHGLGGHAGHWRMNQTAIGNKQFRVIALNLPGYGGSEVHEHIAPENQLKYYAAVLDTFVDAIKLQSVVVAGHSMGAQVSILAALSRPRWLEKLILIAPAGLETFTDAEARMLEAFATPAYFQNQDSAAIVQSFKANFYELPASANMLIAERNQSRHCPGFAAYTQQVSAGVKGMLHAPVANRLQEIDLPVLLLTGEEDGLIPNRVLHPTMRMEMLTDEAKQNIKKLQSNSIPKAGHMLQWEAYERVNHEIIHFLNQ
jgi:pimeloyl-ACP methyl ester carboxylesterase